MASPAASGDSPNAPREQEQHHPEPACREAQKWIEAVTGKSFGDKDFRSALENGILLCELLSAIKPGLVKKINRLPTPIAGLDNLSVFLRGCEELGLKGAQLFDPGDLQDTSIRANLKDSDCNRKLKNVLNTVYWLGKAASGCASYSGPTLNLKEFEGLLAQMKLESEEGGDSSQKRSVRDSGYDCWDSERSESLSPPRHTRDNSLDSLDSFGSRSQHSPSPDVVNRGNGDGRGSDSEADAPNRKPDVRKDDMLARRTSSKEARSSVPFNQFLPNRTNATSYVPTPRRKPHTEEREQRSQPQATADQCKKFTLLHKTSKTVTWAPENNGEKREEEVVTQEVLEQRRMQKLEKAGIKVLPAVVRYSSPPETEEKEPRSPSPNIILRRDNDFLSSQKSAWDSPSDGEEEAAVRKVPDVRKDDLASRRAHRGTVAPKVHQFIPPPLCTDKDRERWEGIRRASQQMLQEKEISEKEAVADIITRKDNPFLNSPSCHEEEEDEEDEGHEGKVKVMPNKQKDDLARRRAQSRPLPHRDGPVSFVSSSMSQADMQKWERLRMSEPSDTSPGPVCQACLVKNYGGPFSGSAKAGRGQGKVVTFGGVTEIEQPIDTVMSSEGEETELLRRLLSKATVAMPTIGLGSQLSERERRVEHQQPMEAPQQQVETTVIRSASQGEWEYGDNEDECGENVPAPDPEKDDMMARRTGSFQKASTAKRNQFLPVPGSVKYNISPVSAMKQLHSRPKLTEKKEGESSIVAVAAEPQALPSKAPTSPTFAVLRERREEKEEKEEKQESEGAMVPNTSATVTAEPLFSPSLVPAPSPGPAQVCSVKSGLEKQKVEERVEEKAEVEERKKDVNEKPRKKPFWLEDDELPPMMMSRRVAFMSEDTESVSMGDMLNEEEVGHLPSLSQSRHEHMHEQYNNFLEDEDHWQDDLARWKNRRRSASQDLIRKEEERKRIEKRMKGEGRDGNKRKSIKTYKEIVEEKERREADLCEAYRSAATPEEAALVLQRYALRFTISDAVLDSLKLPRSTSTPKNELNELDKEQKPESPVNNAEMSEALRQPESPVNNAEMSEALRQPESHVVTNQEHMKPEEIETDTSDQQEKLATSPLTPNSPTSPLSTVTDSQSVSPQSLEFNEPQTQLMESLTAQQAAITGDPQPQTKHTSPQNAQGQPHPTQSANALPSPPSVSSRPIPLLAAKPYCQPGAVLPGHKPIKDGLVRVNGEETEELTVSTPPTSPQHSLQETKDVLSKEAEKDAPPVEAVKSAETAEQQPTETEKSTPSSGSAISSLIEGRNCIITTTIVTELMQKVVEPLHTDTQNDGEVETTGLFEKPEDEKNTQPSSTPSSMEEYSPTVSEGLEESSVTIETPMLNLAKRVNHWVWDPNEERKRLERWQQEQERLLKEQYQREQEKLMKEWEKAQLEVEEEERKHNEEERRILEETVTPLNPTGLLNQVSGQTATTSPGTENDNTKGKNVPLQHNGQKISTGNEDQHASKLHFFQDSGADVEPSKKQELWKTASLDRNTQLNQGQVVKRSGSHDGVTSEQQSSSPKPQPPSPSRCVSGKRLCTGCSQPLGKGAAMIIDTLGLFFHMHCFKCGLCGVQLGDATAGTDVRIRKGMLSCHECYIASRGRGQPTTL
ncbi:LIM and calponin homology domains-containing protein 1-like isoform X6 [Simochromis diagramma]|uniref:LIM and calponin homology domains-containing protein 1-like isoform X6 n=1 Tax=Simochromis diagramma TaxID=43689 RepID=UPI001A7ED793|nr:LIM and calponin homology domains-containing protein 1-like isoform X6 [Simochromis diagramma]